MLNQSLGNPLIVQLLWVHHLRLTKLERGWGDSEMDIFTNFIGSWMFPKHCELLASSWLITRLFRSYYLIFSWTHMMGPFWGSALDLSPGNSSPRKALGHTFPGIQQSQRKPDSKNITRARVTGSPDDCWVWLFTDMLGQWTHTWHLEITFLGHRWLLSTLDTRI